MKLCKIILLLNVLTPLGFGTLYYLFRFNPKSEFYLKHAKNHLYSIIIMIIFLIIVFITGDFVITMIFAPCMFLSYLAGIFLQSLFYFKFLQNKFLNFLKTIMFLFLQYLISNNNQRYLISNDL